MDGDRVATLHREIAAIQRRWGERALHIFGRSTPPHGRSVIPTGFTELDVALQIGGLPRGRITERLGTPTSGMTTIALRTLAQAQAGGDRVGYLDPHATFDPEYAAWCGVDLASLLLVRPRQPADMPDIIFALVGSGGLGVLVVDDLMLVQATPHGGAFLDRALRVLPSTLARSPCALVVLTALPYRPEVIRGIGFHGSALAHAATLRLHVTPAAWRDDERAPPSCHVQVTVLQHPHGPPGATRRITITFEDDWSLA